MIECRNVIRKFDNKVVLNNYNYTFRDNSVTAIMGESGRGKTTLIRCIAGLDKVDGGEIIYSHDGVKEQIFKPNPKIFMMHQHYSNFPWKTCYENLMFPLELRGLDNEKTALEVCGLLEKVGLGECMTKYPGELSGGMNQRLAFARTLVMKPKVLLMDEPMSALDEKTRINMQDLLLEMHRETKNIIILVTHSKEEAKRLSNNIINL